MTDTTDTTPEIEPTEETTEVSDTATDDTDTEPDTPESPNAEAAKWRKKLRDAEAERDSLQTQLDAQRRAIIDWRSTNSARGAVDPQLLDAAGINITELCDDNGHLDMTAVDQFIENTATKFRVHRMVKPNPQQGNPSAAPAQQGLASAFDPKRHQ